MTDAYSQFLARKRIMDPSTGLSVVPPLPAVMNPHQSDIASWALRRGRAAVFAGTGLGKTLIELVWASEVARYTGKPVLGFAPLAVSSQHIREAEKFGLHAEITCAQEDVRNGVFVTNYQKIDHFDLSKFGGVVLDESSILKSTDGHYRTRLIRECASVPFRLAATATPAPNDFMELGNHAEFLGVMSYTDMLATFFTHDGGDTQKWRLKGHAENEFWKWMASWAVMLRKPSDLGYSNDGYDLPPLTQHQHVVSVDYAPSLDTGFLFPMEATSLQERIAARRDTVAERVAMAFRVVIGDACAKLAECLGSQNTLTPGAKNIEPTPPNVSGERAKDDRKSTTPNTCDPTTRPTEKSSNGRRNSRLKSTAVDANDTPQTLSIGNCAKSVQDSETSHLAGLGASNLNTGWKHPNTTHLSIGKEGSAQSAEISRDIISTLITATRQAESAGFFAAPAIQASVISKMTREGWIEPWCIWCNLNSEQDALAKAFGPLAFSVSGSMSDEDKERQILAWIDGERPVMISKPSIMGFGMNFQHCRNTIFVGLNDSFEQIYQAIRRFWRFGQTRPVTVHFIAAETEGAVVANLKRKEADAERMAAAMVLHTASISAEIIRGSVRDRPDYSPTQRVIIPDWLEAA